MGFSGEKLEKISWARDWVWWDFDVRLEKESRELGEVHFKWEKPEKERVANKLERRRKWAWKGNSTIWFLSDRFLCFHTILLCFPGIIGFLFWWLDVNIGDFCMLLWNLSLLALTIHLISNLFSWLYFWHSRLDFLLWNPFEIHFGPPPTSKPVD